MRIPSTADFELISSPVGTSLSPDGLLVWTDPLSTNDPIVVSINGQRLTMSVQALTDTLRGQLTLQNSSPWRPGKLLTVTGVYNDPSVTRPLVLKVSNRQREIYAEYLVEMRNGQLSQQVPLPNPLPSGDVQMVRYIHTVRTRTKVL